MRRLTQLLGLNPGLVLENWSYVLENSCYVLESRDFVLCIKSMLNITSVVPITTRSVLVAFF